MAVKSFLFVIETSKLLVIPWCGVYSFDGDKGNEPADLVGKCIFKHEPIIFNGSG